MLSRHDEQTVMYLGMGLVLVIMATLWLFSAVAYYSVF